MKMTLATAQRYWGESLTTRPAASPAEILSRSGWIRTLGGAEAYLGLAARAEGCTTSTVNASVAVREIQISPTVRGCIYLVPGEDARLCLWIAERNSRRRNARDLEKVGVSAAELDTLGVAVLEAVAQEPVTTVALRKLLPNGLIRSLGAVGKKIGMTSTLPPALRRLEFRGELVRQPVGDRLDSERYAWAIPARNPLERGPAPTLGALADRYLRWAGPATRKGFAAWSGLSQADAKAGLAEAGAVAVEVEGLGACFMSPIRLAQPAPREPAVVSWLPAMDGLFALRQQCSVVVDPAGHDVAIAIFGGRGGAARLGDAKVPLSRTLCLGGRVVGLWEVDPATLKVQEQRFAPVPQGALSRMGTDAAAIEQIFAELGHGRAFSLDKDARLTARLEMVRALASE
ncbi:MAG: winged helix DNA-binding domain-containing protein [Myxococcales bacterium]|nr:winged helix DNA-binding domain-containing protein [Myxococcales bacterium]